jgi:tRNA dimethylallyltransferase
MSALWDERARDPLEGYQILRIGLEPERKALYSRINLRAQKMFDDGLVNETGELLKQYQLTEPLPQAFKSLGYCQAMQLLRNELTPEQAIAAAQQGHRNYAKRQITWFRREPDVTWLPGFGDDPETVQRATELIRNSR